MGLGIHSGMLCAHFSVPVQCLFLSRAAALFCSVYLGTGSGNAPGFCENGLVF